MSKLVHVPAPPPDSFAASVGRLAACFLRIAFEAGVESMRLKLEEQRKLTEAWKAYALVAADDSDGPFARRRRIADAEWALIHLGVDRKEFV